MLWTATKSDEDIITFEAPTPADAHKILQSILGGRGPWSEATLDWSLNAVDHR